MLSSPALYVSRKSHWRSTYGLGRLDGFLAQFAMRYFADVGLRQLVMELNNFKNFISCQMLLAVSKQFIFSQ
ncbi:hypothetical protein BBW68_13675 [Candidatus Erwinia dacicola]|uniref:Uncharacterized protein n=1 Tax=Candidatus Erwinia dacicola TaxID=252393 RepID=A0A1E7YXC1_9GAMM|nr:hypothetical protein BBW68_13675 [Candidatus Erwinia dacicola]